MIQFFKKMFLEKLNQFEGDMRTSKSYKRFQNDLVVLP